MSIYQNLCVGPYVEWAVPVKQGPKPIPDTPEWEWLSEDGGLRLADLMGNIPEEKRGRIHYRVYRFVPGSGRSGEPKRTMYVGGGDVGVIDLTDVDRQAEVAWFARAYRAELRQLRSPVRTMIVCPYYIDTGMFAGVKTRFPWLLPILQEQDVATKVLDGIEAGKRRLIVPWLVRLTPAMRLLPTAAFDAVNDVLGVNKTMEHFTGRPGDVVGD